MVEERVLVDLLVLMGEYNYPVSKRDLRDMIKNYLDRLDRRDTGYVVFDGSCLNCHKVSGTARYGIIRYQIVIKLAPWILILI
jgi:hypothetical protein